jgi:tetratricopeptide (TPR) repeat protein
VCNAIEAVLLNSRPASAPAHVAVLGLPGMGKSLLVSQALLAMQKAHAMEQRDVYFLKLHGRSAASVEEDLLMHARSLGSKIGVAADSLPRQALDKFKGHLSDLRFIAIIDDATGDGLQAAAQFVPVSSALYSVILTSQQPPGELAALDAAHGMFEKRELSKFDDSSSFQLLQNLCKPCSALIAEKDHLAGIARRMYHLPLAVRLFGEYSRSRYQREAKAMKEARKAFMTTAQAAATAVGAPFDEEFADLKFRKEHLASSGACDEIGIARRILNDWTSRADIEDKEVLQSSDKHPRGLVGTVRLALYELERLDTVDAHRSRQLLSILALCPSVRTPWSLFVGHSNSSCVAGLELVTGREGLSRSAVLVQRSGLVQMQGNGFFMHQLLQRVGRLEVAGCVDAALQLIDGRVGDKELQAADVYREFLPAAYHVLKEVLAIDASRSDHCKSVRERIAELMAWLGGGALEVEIRRTILQEVNEDDSTLEYHFALSRFASALERMGQHAQALNLYDRCLASMRHVLPADHLHIAVTIMNMANSYSALGHHAEALNLYDQAIALMRRVLHADHPDIATAMLNTAQSYSALGRHAEALDLQRQVLALRRRVLHADHPDIATAMICTAESCSALGRHAEALDLKEQGLVFRRRVLHAENPDIATAMISTANSCYALGRHAEALDLQQQGLALMRHVLPADHPHIANAMINIGVIYSALGRHAEALDLQQQGLAFRRRVLHADHPDIATAMMNTGEIYSASGRHSEALDLKEQGLAFMRRVLPADHPDIATAMMNTSNSCYALGRHAEALDLREQVLALRRRKLPANHPDIAVSLFNICISLNSSGFTSQCGWFAHEALRIIRCNFPDSHPLVLQISGAIRELSQLHGTSAIQPPPMPSSEHLRIGRLVRMHGLSTHVLNGCQALIFGREHNGRVPVRLVEASDAVRASLSWGKGLEGTIKVENLQAIGR